MLNNGLNKKCHVQCQANWKNEEKKTSKTALIFACTKSVKKKNVEHNGN